MAGLSVDLADGNRVVIKGEVRAILTPDLARAFGNRLLLLADTCELNESPARKPLQSGAGTAEQGRDVSDGVEGDGVTPPPVASPCSAEENTLKSEESEPAVAVAGPCDSSAALEGQAGGAVLAGDVPVDPDEGAAPDASEFAGPDEGNAERAGEEAGGSAGTPAPRDNEDTAEERSGTAREAPSTCMWDATQGGPDVGSGRSDVGVQPAAPPNSDLQIPTFMRRGHPDCQIGAVAK